MHRWEHGRGIEGIPKHAVPGVPEVAVTISISTNDRSALSTAFRSVVGGSRRLAARPRDGSRRHRVRHSDPCGEAWEQGAVRRLAGTDGAKGQSTSSLDRGDGSSAELFGVRMLDGRPRPILLAISRRCVA